MVDPYWIVVWRDSRKGRAPDSPDPDAHVFASESDMIAEIADTETRACDDRVLRVIKVEQRGPAAIRADYLDGVCREHLDDWDAELQHRAGLRAGRI